jgi:hypothetical protein
LYNEKGTWIIGLGVEVPSVGFKSTVHSTTIPVYKNQSFCVDDIKNTGDTANTLALFLRNDKYQ